MWYSNYGFAVDVQGNGEAVTTTGYGDLYAAEGVNAYYTDGFSGTSSASPIVTGAVLLLQSAYKNATGTIITPSQMLDLLVQTGKSQQAGDYSLEYNIGPLPDVMAAYYTIYAGLGMEDVQNNPAIVYPNPNTGNFNLFAPEAKIDASTFTVTNMYGQTVEFSISETGNGILNVNISSASAGIYFTHFSVEGKTYVTKVIVKE